MRGSVEQSMKLDRKVSNCLTAEGEFRPNLLVPLSLICWCTTLRRPFPSREPVQYRSYGL